MSLCNVSRENIRIETGGTFKIYKLQMRGHILKLGPKILYFYCPFSYGKNKLAWVEVRIRGYN